MSNIIDKIQVSGVTYDIGGSGGGGNPTVELTQAEYDALVTAGTVAADTFYVITDAQAGDLTNYYTKTETNTLLGGKADTATTYTKTETDNAITAATSTKQDTLVSGTNIKTINNESILGSGNIDIQGGGKAIEAGRGISITTGETADTVSFNLPISAGTGTNALIIASDTYDLGNKAKGEYSVTLNGGGYHPNYAKGHSSVAEGMDTIANQVACHAEGKSTEAGHPSIRSYYCHAEGSYTKAYGENSHAEGVETSALTVNSHTEGFKTFTSNISEHASGRYNVSSSGSSTFGDSGNTLFSVGNGTADNARHNAFEIRQNGDIYLSSGGTDIKLQDHLGGGGGGTVDQTIISGSTNAVAGGAVYDKFDEVEQVTAAGLNALNDKFGGLKLQQITQSAYDQLQTKDPSTLYIVTDS